ncbi:head-tail connector protein [Pararhizobium mangrovi]|uniref:PhiE125 gp8 family phage protein n=1 Tax=Pararhizobium mangrovi TaxID=2590452 RepID=A0A506UHG3_9HYPH|nr:phage head-tail connector protein [Pararhizobium mangrovi]TPW32756.1 hypothetical protein FJU11_00590 [Pararhizobium mangrovi]
MSLFMTEPALGQVVPLADMKAWLRLDGSDEDDLVGELIAVATRHLERETGLALLSQGWRLTLDGWPTDGTIVFARTPVRTIDAVKAYDADGTGRDVQTGGFVLDRDRRPVRLYIDGSAFAVPADNGVEVDFTAGFGDAASDVPDDLKHAIRLHVAHLYEFRGAVPMAQQPASVPAGYDRLIDGYRRRAL